ncbi:MAG: tRNA lysidine(34) synthetase TilS [Deltaproteobacteria bacterium]|nr:tRNA lysidine(34) synthetase TilS [Deltaproteobacteria bacterium]
MERIFRQTLKRSRLFSGGEGVLVGLSGGPDSVALLSLLRAVARDYRLTLRAAHLDHGIRPGAKEEAAFVEKLCAAWQIPLVVERAEVPRAARDLRRGLEETARDLRRSFLLRIAEETGCVRIALGHHLGDQAETVLHRLIRGSGPTGLSAMRLAEGPILRPLLSFSRGQIRDYLERNGLAFVEDDSNRDCRFTRNRIRHQLIPLLRDFNPKIEEQLGRMAEIFASEEAYWHQETERLLAVLGAREGTGWNLDLAGLRRLPTASRRRLLRRLLEELRGTPLGLSWRQFEMLERVIDSGRPQAETFFPGGWAGRDYDGLRLREAAPEAPFSFSVALEGAGTVDLPGVGSLSLAISGQRRGEDRWSVEFDADRIAFPVLIRSFEAGDRFRPAGMTGTKKLKELFIDLKIPLQRRPQVPLVIASGEILWVAGIRRSRHFPTAPETAKVLRVTFRPQRGSNLSL